MQHIQKMPDLVDPQIERVTEDLYLIQEKDKLEKNLKDQYGITDFDEFSFEPKQIDAKNFKERFKKKKEMEELKSSLK